MYVIVCGRRGAEITPGEKALSGCVEVIHRLYLGVAGHGLQLRAQGLPQLVIGVQDSQQAGTDVCDVRAPLKQRSLAELPARFSPCHFNLLPHLQQDNSAGVLYARHPLGCRD